jgi:hypothetical protein
MKQPWQERDRPLGEWSRPSMQDEGDLYTRPRLTWRMIVGCLAGAAVLYLLLTAALVLTHG